VFAIHIAYAAPSVAGLLRALLVVEARTQGSLWITGSFLVRLLPLLFGAAQAPLFLSADFAMLLRLCGFCPTKLLLHVISQEAPRQKAVQSLRAAALDLHRKPRWSMVEAYAG
jgi:hypothetical protein